MEQLLILCILEFLETLMNLYENGKISYEMLKSFTEVKIRFLKYTGLFEIEDLKEILKKYENISLLS